MGIEYLKLHQDDCYQRLDEIVVRGFQTQEAIRRDYSANKNEAGGVTEEMLTRWVSLSKEWTEDSLRVLREVFVSDQEYWLFVNARVGLGIPSGTNIKYWNIVALIEARSRELVRFKEFVRERFNVQLVYIAGDNIQQTGDSNSVKK